MSRKRGINPGKARGGEVGIIACDIEEERKI
jgi:hypothetical protein